MKLKATLPKTRTLMALGLCSCLLVGQPLLAVGKTAKKVYPIVNGEDEPAKKSKKATKKANKATASLNNSSVKIFPDALKREMHVVAKDNNTKEIDFFVFDVNGTLVQNYRMKSKDHFKISGLKRGTYVYRVFCGDEETASGKFEIR
jgi:hypothetical protein